MDGRDARKPDSLPSFETAAALHALHSPGQGRVRVHRGEQGARLFERDALAPARLRHTRLRVH